MTLKDGLPVRINFALHPPALLHRSPAFGQLHGGEEPRYYWADLDTGTVMHITGNPHSSAAEAAFAFFMYAEENYRTAQRLGVRISCVSAADEIAEAMHEQGVASCWQPAEDYEAFRNRLAKAFAGAGK